MVRMKFIFLIILSILLSSCVTLNGMKETPQKKYFSDISFEKSEKYELDLSQLKDLETDPPNFIFLVYNLETGEIRKAEDDEEPNLVAITEDELVKIEKLVELKNALKKITIAQEQIINLERQKFNLLLDLYKYQGYLLEMTQEMRIEENKRHFREKIMDRATLVFMFIGGILVSAL